MSEGMRAVLKKDMVRMSAPGGGAAAPGGQPTAQILEQDASHAVIQVTCSCGSTIRINCDYEARPDQAAPPQPKPEKEKE